MRSLPETPNYLSMLLSPSSPLRRIPQLPSPSLRFMFSKSVSRVALSAPPKSNCALASVATVCKRNFQSSRSSNVANARHQRRHSSSKASFPPGGPRGSEPATENTANAAAEDEKTPNNGRLSRRRSRDSSATDKATVKARDEPFANIPAVPSTNYLQLGDVHTSSFFSLHRPISVTTPFPPVDNPRTISLFDSIFKPLPSKTHKPSDVLYTMSTPVPALNSSAQSGEEKEVRWEILQQSSSNVENANGSRRGHRGSNVIHLDGPPPHQSLEELVRQFRPFNVPPAPVPFDEEASQSASTQKRDGRQSLRDANEHDFEYSREDEDFTNTVQSRESRKVFTTTLTMTEATSPSGQTTYSVSASPIVEQRAARVSAQSRSSHKRPLIRQPFLARLYERQRSLEDFLEDRAERDGKSMWALSVKRQRKLKMKKHKYKKLMRRTRNLRRKEGRL